MADLRTTTRAIQSLAGMPVAQQDGLWGPLTASAVLQALEARGTPASLCRGRGAPAAKHAPSAAPGGQTFDDRTERMLATLDPKAQEKFRPFVEAAKATAAALGCDYIAISGNRSWAEQDALYAKGRTAPGPKVTNARGGYSAHNFGIALDFGAFRAGRYLDEEDPATATHIHQAVAAHAADHGLDWGGAWASFPDPPHFEVRTGLSIAEKRTRYHQRGTVL